MAFIFGFVLGMLGFYTFLRVSFLIGKQGEFRYCNGCPCKLPNFDDDVEGDLIEESDTGV